MAVSAKTRHHKCGKCQGEPHQHNLRDRIIIVNGEVYSQHGFRFTGGN